MSITPFNLPEDRIYPQTYDGCNPDAKVRNICDFKSLLGDRLEPTTCDSFHKDWIGAPNEKKSNVEEIKRLAKANTNNFGAIKAFN